jgi:hypothetical protein
MPVDTFEHAAFRPRERVCCFPKQLYRQFINRSAIRHGNALKQKFTPCLPQRQGMNIQF